MCVCVCVLCSCWVLKIFPSRWLFFFSRCIAPNKIRTLPVWFVAHFPLRSNILASNVFQSLTDPNLSNGPDSWHDIHISCIKPLLSACTCTTIQLWTIYIQSTIANFPFCLMFVNRVSMRNIVELCEVAPQRKICSVFKQLKQQKFYFSCR